MIKITKGEVVKKCDNCLECYGINKISFGFYYFVLCDRCLKEMNYNMTKYLEVNL